MRRFSLSGWILAALTFNVAAAADRPEIGPAAGWVLPPVQADSAAPAAPDAALQVLLSDQQIRITSEVVETYMASAVRIRTPQGLGAMGTLSFSWKPDTDVLTVHQLSVTRDGMNRDLLGTGADFTVMRREDLLEQAVLTGALTAVLQPPGLQVGDVVEMRYTLSRRDPVVADTPDGVHVWPNTPISKVRLRLLWPESLPLRWRASSFMPAAQPTNKDGWRELAYQMDNLVPLLQPSGAPARFAALRMVEHTTFQDWQHLSQRLAPLYQKASTLAPNSPLRAEVARIRTQNKTDATRAAAALRLVQDQIRYVLLAMNTGGLVPASADDTWQRKFGDCKAKTSLLLALLRELGIEAEPVAVSSGFGDGMDTRLSAIGLFDHVLIRSRIDGKTYWLDGTRLGDRSLALIEPPPYLWALPLVARGSDLVAIPREPLQAPQIMRALEIDAREGVAISAPFRAEMVMTGDAARALQRDWGNVPEANREEGLRTFWRQQYNGLTIEKTETRFDDELGKLTWTASGTVVMEWDPEYDTYEPHDMGLGYRVDYTRPKGTDADAPYSVGFPTYERTTETIRLPSSTGFSVTGTDIDTKVAGREFRRKARVEKGTFTAETNYRSVAPEFPARETTEAQRVLLEMSRNNLYLKKSSSYLPTTRELQAAAGTALDSAADYSMRGAQSMIRGLREQAIADFDQALQRDAKLVPALIGRATARTQLTQFDAARTDLQAVLVVDPENTPARRMLSSLEMTVGRLEQALEWMNQVVGKEQAAQDLFSRSILHALLGKPELALQDCNAAIAKEPNFDQAYSVQAYFLKTELLRFLNRRTEIPAVADALQQGLGGTVDGTLAAAALLFSAGDGARARERMDKHLRDRPSTPVYLLRARIRDDKKGAMSDLEEALKPDPESLPVHMDVVTTLLSHKWYSEALAALTPLEKLSGVTAKTANLRGVSLWHLGNKAAALAAFGEARALVTAPGMYNTICWDKAMFDAALEEALKDCDLALEKLPDCAACMDSRAFVLLRSGRTQESVTAYDASLKARPLQGFSLYGRGLARLRLGDKEAGERDLLTARFTSPSVQSTFESYGVMR